MLSSVIVRTNYHVWNNWNISIFCILASPSPQFLFFFSYKHDDEHSMITIISGISCHRFYLIQLNVLIKHISALIVPIYNSIYMASELLIPNSSTWWMIWINTLTITPNNDGKFSSCCWWPAHRVYSMPFRYRRTCF